MTQFTRNKIYEKLENLKEYYGYLVKLKDESESEGKFIADFHLFGNVERYLQSSIQAIIDISHLLIIDLNINRPDDNYEVISLLHKYNIIDGDLADTLTSMVGLRNILVHEYGKIDRKKIYKILTTKLDDIDKFKKSIVDYLDK